jgi:hypothetical protein
MLMRTFVNYFGGKWLLARHYGPPQRDHVVECFGGFCGYSTYWEPPRVTLIEKDPTVIGVWRYLQRASREEILSIPTDINHVDELHGPQEQKSLVGFWHDTGMRVPAKQRNNWARTEPNRRFRYWGPKIRRRIADQVDRIRHWTIIEGDYRDAPDVIGHWFIDPPYSGTGHLYRFNGIEYPALAEWCRQRRGYVQVCEAEGATWLPFKPFLLGNGYSHRGRGFSAEALYEFETTDPPQIELIETK